MVKAKKRDNHSIYFSIVLPIEGPFLSLVTSRCSLNHEMCYRTARFKGSLTTCGGSDSKVQHSLSKSKGILLLNKTWPADSYWGLHHTLIAVVSEASLFSAVSLSVIRKSHAEKTRQPNGYWSPCPEDFTIRCSWVILRTNEAFQTKPFYSEWEALFCKGQ